jgi:hypothetical protein
MDTADFSTLFDHYSVSVTQIRVAWIDRFISRGLDVAVEVDVAIIAADFFESLKAEVSLSPLQIQVTTTQLLTLNEMAAYISHIFPPSLKEAARVSPTFAPVTKIRVAIPSVTLDLAYDDKQLLPFLVESPINVNIRTKDFVTDIGLDIDTLRVNEFLTGWDPFTTGSTHGTQISHSLNALFFCEPLSNGDSCFRERAEHAWVM